MCNCFMQSKCSKHRNEFEIILVVLWFCVQLLEHKLTWCLHDLWSCFCIYITVSLAINVFFTIQHCVSTFYAIAVLSVHLSVCVWHYCVVSIFLNISSVFFSLAVLYYIVIGERGVRAAFSVSHSKMVPCKQCLLVGPAFLSFLSFILIIMIAVSRNAVGCLR